MLLLPATIWVSAWRSLCTMMFSARARGLGAFWGGLFEGVGNRARRFPDRDVPWLGGDVAGLCASPLRGKGVLPCLPSVLRSLGWG